MNEASVAGAWLAALPLLSSTTGHEWYMIMVRNRVAWRANLSCVWHVLLIFSFTIGQVLL